MQIFAASEAKNKFTSILDLAQREPVTIEKKGRPIVVVLSVDEYKRLEIMEDKILGTMAKKAGKEGYIGAENSNKLIQELLNVKD